MPGEGDNCVDEWSPCALCSPLFLTGDLMTVIPSGFMSCIAGVGVKWRADDYFLVFGPLKQQGHIWTRGRGLCTTMRSYSWSWSSDWVGLWVASLEGVGSGSYVWEEGCAQIFTGHRGPVAKTIPSVPSPNRIHCTLAGHVPTQLEIQFPASLEACSPAVLANGMWTEVMGATST